MWPAQRQGTSIPGRVLLGSANSLDPGIWSPNHYGDRVELAASESRQLTTITDKALYSRWRVYFRTERRVNAGPVVGAARSFPIRWTITTSTESGIIVREVTTLDGTAQSIYVTGRSLTILAENLSPTEVVQGFYALDEGDSGNQLDWQTGELLPATGAVPVQLSIPPFCHEVTIQTDGTSSIVVTGQDATGAVFYTHTFPIAGGATGTFPVNPLLTYLVAASGAAWNGAACYKCRG